jgi:dihydrofolate reductase
MSTLTIDLISSLDGFASAENWPGYWGFEGPEMFEFYEKDLAEDHMIVMGANTYRVMSGIVVQEEDPSFDRMAEIPKVVFSSTLKPPLSWANTRVIDTDAVDAIKVLKQGDVPIRTMGSLSLNRSLLNAGVVDRYRVVVFPVITGLNGRDPIYAGWPDVKLDMVQSRTLDGRLQLLEYVPTVL